MRLGLYSEVVVPKTVMIDAPDLKAHLTVRSLRLQKGAPEPNGHARLGEPKGA